MRCGELFGFERTREISETSAAEIAEAAKARGAERRHYRSSGAAGSVSPKALNGQQLDLNAFPLRQRAVEGNQTAAGRGTQPALPTHPRT